MKPHVNLKKAVKMVMAGILDKNLRKAYKDAMIDATVTNTIMKNRKPRENSREKE